MLNKSTEGYFSNSFFQINPQHTIPTIDDNGFVMWESRPIMAYLVSKYAKNDCLYPRDARKRGIVDQMLYFDLGYLQENVMKTYMPIVFGRAATPSEENIESLEKSFVILNKYLEDNEFLAGDILTIADISIVVSVNLAVEAFSFDVGRYDNVAAWYDRCKNALEKFAFTEINQPGNEMVKQMYESNLSVDS
ncbi:glutathione S-transferase 1-1-like [Prorops nasuta]|uniref:glutathione S-transferase 1-1-like n=1 Tax=Prorops nasuta TaxID=863751 RepID=UPI0034D00533